MHDHLIFMRFIVFDKSLLQKITIFYFTVLQNVIYSCAGKLEF